MSRFPKTWDRTRRPCGISSPNTHAQLESFYAVPQIGAVLVPLNYRLTADDFVYLIDHSGSCMICADRDYLETIENIREQLPKVEHFVALTGHGEGWLNYEAMIDASSAEFARTEIHETDLLTINYTSGTTSRPKGVMITHRNAWMNSVGTLLYAPMTCADRYLWTLPMFSANGWTSSGRQRLRERLTFVCANARRARCWN